MQYGILISEKNKLYSYGWGQLGLVAAFLLAPLILTVSDSYLGSSNEVVLSAVLEMLYLGQIGPVILGAAIFGQEFTHSALRTSLLAVPSRMTVFITKFTLLAATIFISTFVSAFLCVICMTIKNGFVPTFSFISVMLKHVTLVFISGLGIGIISAGLSVIFRSLVIPIAILFTLILGLSQMLFSVLVGMKYTPVLATLNLFMTQQNNTLLAGNMGLLTQVFWEMGILVIAGSMFVSRDVR